MFNNFTPTKVSAADSMAQLSNKVVITSSTFLANIARKQGGSISISGSSVVNMTDTLVLNSTAKDMGGALIMAQRSKLFLLRSEFRRNSAINGGGAIFIKNHDSHKTQTVDIVESTFVENDVGESAQGGALLIQKVWQLIVQGSNFVGNSGGRGGAIFLHHYNDHDSAAEHVWRLQDSMFLGNTAMKEGGALEVYRANEDDAVEARSRYTVVRIRRHEEPGE